MKTLTAFITLLICTLSLNSQIVYYDASEFPLYGKATDASATRYERLPDSLRNISSQPLWELGQNSAGMAIRFRSNSTTIAAKWEVLLNRNMNHMTPTGIKGLDLYCYQDGKWVSVNSARPSGKVNQTTIIKDMVPQEREYMLYLPLYDGLTSLSIGVDSLAMIDKPVIETPVREKPIVLYGTSILQGACASRAGMAHTNILSRWLNRECINLGFSGQGQLNLEIAEVIANVDAGCFVLDFVPNATVEQMDERFDDFYRIIRAKHPNTPIVLLEDPIFTHSLFNQPIAKEVADKNKKINQLYAEVLENGDKNIYFVSSKDMIGDDNEATVDGVHFTDLGMMRYAELVYPVIKQCIE